MNYYENDEGRLSHHNHKRETEPYKCIIFPQGHNNNCVYPNSMLTCSITIQNNAIYNTT